MAFPNIEVVLSLCSIFLSERGAALQPMTSLLHRSVVSDLGHKPALCYGFPPVGWSTPQPAPGGVAFDEAVVPLGQSTMGM